MTADLDIPLTPGRPPPQARLPVTDISQWVERFSIMAATLSSRFSEKAPELFAFQAQIIRAERNYEPGRWVLYDRQFRREALARRDLNWSVTNIRLYSEARGEQKPFPAANSACRTTTRPPTVPEIRTTHGRIGYLQPRPLNLHHCLSVARALEQNFVGVIVRGAASRQGASSPTHAGAVGGHTLTLTAQATGTTGRDRQSALCPTHLQ